MFTKVETETTIPDTQGHQAIIRVTGEVDCDTRAVRSVCAYDVTDGRDPRTNIAHKYESAKLQSMLLDKAACPPVDVPAKGTQPGGLPTTAPGSLGKSPKT